MQEHRCSAFFKHVSILSLLFLNSARLESSVCDTAKNDANQGVYNYYELTYIVGLTGINAECAETAILPKLELFCTFAHCVKKVIVKTSWDINLSIVCMCMFYFCLKVI